MYLNSFAENIFLAGDFNARIGGRLDFIEYLDTINERCALDKTVNSYCDAFLEFIKDVKMCIVNGRVTPKYDNYTCVNRNGCSVVDYIITDYGSLERCKMCKVFPVNELMNENSELKLLLSNSCKTPDHSIILIEFEYGNDIEDTEETGTDNKNLGYRKYSFQNQNHNFLNNEIWNSAMIKIIETLENNLKTKEQLNVLYENLIQSIITEMDTYLEFKDIDKTMTKKYKHSKPYWNEQLTLAWKSMMQCEKTFRKFKGHRNIKSKLRDSYHIARTKFDKLLRTCERNYNNNVIRNIENMCKSDHKQFWNKMKQMGPKRKNIPLRVDKNGQTVINPTEVLGIWKSDFEQLYNPPPCPVDPDFLNNINHEKEILERNYNNKTEISDDLLNSPISFIEVKRSIILSKIGKAPGIDCIPNEVLKNPRITNLFFKLYTFCFENHIVPSLWLKSIVKPIPKSSDKSPYVPMNYRGISLISCVGKIYSSILNCRVSAFLEENNILVEEQNGFRKSRSCEDHIYVLSSLIECKKAQNQNVFAAFIDMSKAFDCINRNLLYFKLLKNNIGGKILYAIQELYKDTMSCVEINGMKTDWFATMQGVRQGDNLSPTLFSIYINDLAVELKRLNLGVKMGNLHICILLYADDIVLVSENEVNLQLMLNHVHNWCYKWQMKVNIEKTKVVHFRNKRKKKSKFVFKIDDCTLEIVDSYRYLGVIFDEYLNFDKCAKTLSEAAGRALGSIITKFKQYKNIGYHTFTKLYKAGVNSILDYGASVWGFGNHKYAQQVQNRAIRYFLGVHKNSPNFAIQSEMGWLNVQYHFYICAMRYWNRLLKMNDDRLAKRINEYQLINFSANTWCGKLCAVLEELHKVDYIIDGKMLDLPNIKDDLFDLMHDVWSNNVGFKPKLRNYTKFKQDINMEEYLVKSTRYQRSLLAQLRLGILPLQVEVGRYYRKPLNERICLLCNDQVVEDECHFLCYCKLYKTEREKFLIDTKTNISITQVLPPDELFITLMKSDVTYLLKFVECIWNKRKSFITS